MSASNEWIGYKPQFFDYLDEFLQLHRKTLKTLVGKQIHRVRVPWHSDWNRWDGGPIVLEFQALRLALEGAWAQFSATVYSVDTDTSLPAHLVWVHDTPELKSERFVGSQVKAVNALTYDNGDRIAGLEFRFANGEILNIFEDDKISPDLFSAHPVTLLAHRHRPHLEGALPQSRDQTPRFMHQVPSVNSRRVK